MNSDRWHKLQGLFLDALERAPDERHTFIEQACAGDRELFDEVGRMLAAHARGDSFAEPPAGVEIALGLNPAQELIGKQLGDFVIEREIGRGGMGIVFRAQQVSLARAVALKILPPALSSSTLRFERFEREARAASKLDHPCLAPVISFGRDHGVVYYAMKLVDGPSLWDVIERARQGQSQSEPCAVEPRDPQSVARFVVPLLQALQHTHEMGVLHRDVKPANVLVQADGTPCLIDFGLAKDVELASLTRTGDSSGTPHYMSPEQVRAERGRIDARTDVYSVGALLYELLTCQPPFGGSSTAEVFQRITDEQAPSVRALNKRVPVPLEVICLKALRKEPGERYESAGHMARDLDRFLAGEPILARAPSIYERAERAILRRRSLIKTAPLLMIAGAGAGAWMVASSVRAGRLARVALRWNAPGMVRVYAQRKGVATKPFVSIGEVAQSQTGSVSFSLEPGDYRLTVCDDRGGFAELRRQLQGGVEHESEVRLGSTEAAIAGMVSVSGGSVHVNLFGQKAVDAAFDEDVEGFYLDPCTVTNDEFGLYLEAMNLRPEDVGGWGKVALTNWRNPPRSDWGQLPVTDVSWRLARDYAEWCHKRLPTLPEFNLAVSRAIDPWLSDLGKGARNRFHLRQDDDQPARQVTNAVYAEDVAPASDPRGGAGPLGLHHPIGNVLEWLETPNEIDAAQHPSRYAKGYYWGDSVAKALRGLGTGTFLASGFSAPDIGFRCAKSANP